MEKTEHHSLLEKGITVGAIFDQQMRWGDTHTHTPGVLGELETLLGTGLGRGYINTNGKNTF